MENSEKYKKLLVGGLILILLGIYAYFLFYHIGTRPLIDWDESIYTQVAKEAFLNHHYFSFTFWGNLWFEKPPLIIWMIALGYKIFGISELGARFFVPIFAFATIILTLLMVKKITNSILAIFLTLACYSICYQFFFNSFFLNFDTVVAFFVVLSIYSFLLALNKPKYFYLFFTAISLGVLTKSVIGFLPLPILLIYLIASRQFKKLNNKHFFYGLVLASTIILPWHIWETIKYGKEFWNSYLFYHVIDRFAKPLENNGGAFNYYLPILRQNTIFEILIIVSSLYFIFQSFKKNLNYFLLLLCNVFIFLFFSTAQTKGFSYMVVIYPYITAMFGITLSDLLNKSPSKILKISVICILVMIFLGLGFQEQNYKILSLENSADAMTYTANKNIALFINTKYPGKAVYASSWQEASLAFEFYLGHTVTSLPTGTILPNNFTVGAKYRVFHQIRKSVYNFPDFIYIAQ